MQLTEDKPTGYHISHYSDQHIVINDTPYQQSILLTASGIISTKLPSTISELKLEHAQLLNNIPLEIVIIGSNEAITASQHELLLHFGRQGIGLEYMRVDAACRTYNILAAEERKVAMFLLL